MIVVCEGLPRDGMTGMICDRRHHAPYAASQVCCSSTLMLFLTKQAELDHYA